MVLAKSVGDLHISNATSPNLSALILLPREVLINQISLLFPCRDAQISSLLTLLSVPGIACKAFVLYGLEATGKSAITAALLEALAGEANVGEQGAVNFDSNFSSLRYAVIKSAECITGRHLLEKIVAAVADAIGHPESGRCENFAQLAAELERLMKLWRSSGSHNKKFVLVFDGIDRQREAPHTLVAGLTRLGEVIPGFTSIFIINSPGFGFLHAQGVPHIHFPNYNKAELQQILSHMRPTPQLPGGYQETKDVWHRFCGATWDTLSKHSYSDLVSMRTVCLRLWPRFVRPILDGTHSAKEFSKVMVVSKHIFQDDSVLVPSILSEPKSSSSLVSQYKSLGIASQLPYYSRLLLVSAYLASYNRSATDQSFFMKAAAAKRRKKGGGTAKTRIGVEKHRKIQRKLLGPQAFVLERMLAIFLAIMEDADGRGRYKKGRGADRDTAGSADIQMALATLMSLRLIVKLGATNSGDTLDGGSRYRVAVDWEVMRSVARSAGVEPEDYLAE